MKLYLCGIAVIAVLANAGGVRAADGMAVYNQDCAMCHNNIAPKIGDKGAWTPLIKQGADMLIANVIKGKGAMPPRASKPDLSDADIKAAVEYIESKSQ